eukprot:2313481-Rhodomonas_salina.4
MGARVFLEGITKGAVEVQSGACSFPTIDSQGNPVVLETKGRGILFKEATSTIVLLSNLLYAGCNVHFEKGRESYQQYGGTITCPDGTVIVMTYDGGIWQLPTLIKQRAVTTHHFQYLSTVKSLKDLISDDNPYKALLDVAFDVELMRESVFPSDLKTVEEVDTKVMQLLHDKWGHLSNSKMEQIVRYYQRKGFPPGFLKALKHFNCKACALCNRASVYKHTKLVQKKIVNNKLQKTATLKSTGKAEILQALLEMELT